MPAMAWNPLEHLKPVPYRTRYRPAKLTQKLSVPYAIFGAQAMIPHLPERRTFSLDLLIEARHQQDAVQSLKKHSSHYDYFWHTHDFFILKRTKQYLCLINSSAPWVSNAISAAQSQIIRNEPTIPFPWLILSKMNTGSRQDLLDCARLIARTNDNHIQETKKLLETHLPEALPELRKLYQAGIQELKSNPTYINKPTAYSAWLKMNAEVDTSE